jgi:hypothetical protein
MKKFQIEPIMSQLDDFLIVNAHELLLCIEIEDYETACIIRDETQSKIDQIYNLLLNKELTKLDPEVLLDFINNRNREYIKEFEDLFNIPKERRLTF